MSDIAYPNIVNLCHTLSVYFNMSKKTEKITFRTTEECTKHLDAIQEKYDLPIGNIIHRMIESFAKDGNVDSTFKKIM
jgi:hypothetical protein